MQHITTNAIDMEYNKAYFLFPENNIEKIYKLSVSEKGYLTFSADNPYKNIYTSTFKTTLSLVNSDGCCLWLHEYDYNYENNKMHDYRIGLDAGTYYFIIRTNRHKIKVSTSSVLYTFNYTKSDSFEIEPNNTKSMANTYIFGHTISGEYNTRTNTIFPKGIADDYYALSFVKGRTYEITFNMLQKGLYRSSFTLEDSNGKQLLCQDDLESKKCYYDCNSSGTYYLHVGDNSPTAISIIQPYSFKINEYFSSPKTSIRKIKRYGKKALIKWKPISGVTGYNVQFGINKKSVHKIKPITVLGCNNSSLTIPVPRKKKTYYVRIRTFTTSYGHTEKSDFTRLNKIKKIKKKHAVKKKK